MRRVLFAFFGLVVFVNLSLAQRYVVDTVIGNVTVKSKNKVRSIEVGYVLKEGDTIITAKDSECYISVENKGYIRVEGRSSITFEQIGRAFKGGSKDSITSTGSIFLSVKGIFGSGKALNVKTQTAFATVRGTEFVVEVEKKLTKVYVLEGEVAVAPLFSTDEEELAKRTVQVKKGEKIEISEIDVINATSFLKEGEDEEYYSFLEAKRKSLVASERERFEKRMKMLRDLQRKRSQELERKRKEYLKNPSKLFEEEEEEE
ncbi:MAG: FecR family protein [Brevinematia bacterium]